MTDKGVEVIGVSGDAVSNQTLFKKTHNLNFTLLSDESGDVAKKFGVPVSKGGTFPFKDADGNTVELKRGVTIQRWTFVIGKDGKILYQAKGDIANDPKLVLQAIEKTPK